MQMTSIASFDGRELRITPASIPMRTHLVRAQRPATLRRHRAMGVAGLASIGLFLVGMPLVSMGLLAVLATSGVVIASRGIATPGRTRLDPLVPETIASIELRETYRSILGAYAEIERVVDDAPRLGPAIAPVLERCVAAVRLCGKLALLANPLQRSLDVHDANVIRSEVDRLRARLELTSDEQIACTLSYAVAARVRELATREQTALMRDRIHARLELCRAALVSFAATITTLHVAEEEQLALAAGTVIEHLEGVGEDLELFESAFTLDPAA
jgi:hypothetical protein